MENLTNKLLELEDGTSFMVIRQAAYKGKTYFLTAEVTPDKEGFTNRFCFLEKLDGEELMVQTVKDKEILNILAKNIKIDE